MLCDFVAGQFGKRERDRRTYARSAIGLEGHLLRLRCLRSRFAIKRERDRSFAPGSNAKEPIPRFHIITIEVGKKAFAPGSNAKEPIPRFHITTIEVGK